MSSENLLDKNRKEWLMSLAEKEAERTSAELEQIWQEEKRKLAEKCPYSNEKEREFFGYKEEEERQAEHDKEYPIKIILTYKPELEYITKQEAIESLKVRFKMSQIYDIYVPIYDEIYDPVYSFTRREAYTFIKSMISYSLTFDYIVVTILIFTGLAMFFLAPSTVISSSFVIGILFLINGISNLFIAFRLTRIIKQYRTYIQ